VNVALVVSERRLIVNMLNQPGDAGVSSARDGGPSGARWMVLYRVGGAAALASAVFIPIQILVFIIWPPPLEGTAVDWFTLFRDNRLVGLLDLDLLLVTDNVLLVAIFLALYVLLRRDSESVMAIATALGFLGIVFFIASNPAFEMLSLSDGYAAATTEAQRSTFLAAGEAMLATWQGTTFQAAYILGSVAGIAVGAVMLRSGTFSNVTGWMAILGNAVGFGLYVPVVGVYVSVFSVLFLEIWYILISRRLFRLGKPVSSAEVSP
jgi:hypothetical protein